MYCLICSFFFLDDHHVEKKKVTKEKLSEEDHSIFKLFGCDKSCKCSVLLHNICQKL